MAEAGVIATALPARAVRAAGVAPSDSDLNDARVALNALKGESWFRALAQRAAAMDGGTWQARGAQPTSGWFVCDPDKGITAVMTGKGLAFISNARIDGPAEALVAQHLISVRELTDGLHRLESNLTADSKLTLSDICGCSAVTTKAPAIVTYLQV